MSDNHSDPRVATVPDGVGDAVGVPKYWYVAIVNHNTEKASAHRLLQKGYDCYVATQEETRIWRNGRKAKTDRVVIPATLFIYCTEKERRLIVHEPYIFRFLTNRAASVNGLHPVAVIPDYQIQTLRFMLGNADTPVKFSSHIYKANERVHIVRGKLRGLEGKVQRGNDGKTTLVVALDFLGGATLEIDPLDVAPIQ